MDGLMDRVARIASPRGLVSLSLMLSLVGAQGGRGTLAYFTSSTASAGHTFVGGTINLTTSTVLPGGGGTDAVGTFKWSATGTGAGNGGAGGVGDTTNCATVKVTAGSPSDATPETDYNWQGMQSGSYCVTKITIGNTATGAVDAWMRIRIARDTADGTPENEALNNRLRFYMAEYTQKGSEATMAAAQAADCTPTNFKPSRYDSAAVIANVTGDATTTIGRTALTTLGTAGKTLGIHTGQSADYLLSGGTPAYANTNVYNQKSSGLALLKATGGAPVEGTMKTAHDANRNAFNLVGNDEVSNPVLSTDGSLTTPNNGTPNLATGAATANGGTLTTTNNEASLIRNQVRYYCAAIFLPGDTDTSIALLSDTEKGNMGLPTSTYTDTQVNTLGDNSAKAGSMTYYFHVTAAQKAGRTRTS